MTTQSCGVPKYSIKEPKGLSPRIKWLRDYYFQGNNRKWNNEFVGFTTGTCWDIQYQEGNSLHCAGDLHIFPHLYRRLPAGLAQGRTAEGFWEWVPNARPGL
jgi:hypothetical protein